MRHAHGTSNYLLGVPLLIIPFAIYNIVAFLFDMGFGDVIFTVRLMSRAEWGVTTSDVLITLSILLLFVEIMKSTRAGMRSVVDHILSLVLLLVMLGEFMAVSQAATSTFFQMSVIQFVDVVAGFSVAVRSAQRDITVDGDRMMP